MKFLDYSSSSRMTRLMELTRVLRECRTPYDALLMYCKYLGDAFPNRAQLVLTTRGLPPGQYRVWRLRGDDGIEHFELTNPWTKLTAPALSGGIISKIIERAVPHLVHEIDWSSDPHFAQWLGPFRALIAVPLFNDRLPLNWSIMCTRDPAELNAADLEFSVNRATLIGSLLDSLYVGSELTRANAQIDAELRRMARIQRALLPDPIPQIPGLRLAASYQTFTHVGGDLYDFFKVQDRGDRWGIFIGDASGHGPAAAVAAAMVQATLRACAPSAAGPAHLLQTLNLHLCEKRIEGTFVTAFIAFYDPSTRRLTYSVAGHPPPLIPSFTGRVSQILDRVGGLPLGIDGDAAFDEAAIELVPGQVLLLYTDGITEARGPKGTMFGVPGIEQSLKGCGQDAQDVIDRLRHALSTHQSGQHPDDDQTAVVLQCVGK